MRLDIEVPEGVQERWAVCPSYDLYEASSLGRVRRKMNQRPIAQRVNKQGYAVVTLSMKRHVMVRFVHVLVLDAFVGPKPQEHFVQHIDGNKLNNVVENLRYARGYTYSGAVAPNLGSSNTQYVPPGSPWTVAERGFVRFHASSLEALRDALNEFLNGVASERLAPDNGESLLEDGEWDAENV